jgi:hypothetical protein
MRVIPLATVAIAVLLSAAPRAMANFDLSKCYGTQVDVPAQRSNVEVCPPTQP